MKKHFDLLVLGGGSAGLATAQMAASRGAKVALIEKDDLGGTCVNVGCVPKKIMWYAGELAEFHRLAGSYGFKQKPAQLDFKKLVLGRERYIKTLNESYLRRLNKLKITYIKGFARFLDAHTLLVNNEAYTADHIVLATGCTPLRPSLKGAEFALDSDDFFALKSLPQKVAIVGAGYIAVELASILNQLGAEVTLALRHDRPLRQFDAVLGKTLVEIMSAQGIQVLTEHQATEITRDAKKQFTLHFAGNKKIRKLDAVLFAIGRHPRTASLNLKAIKVKTDAHGFIVTDKADKTSVSHIYAIGDVTGKKQLTPVAVAAGRLLAKRLFGKKQKAILDYSNIPTVIFSHPPLASIGLSEEAAIEKYGKTKIVIYKSRFNSLFYALSKEKTPSLFKLVTLKSNGKIIGCHLLGRGVDEILQGFAVAIKMGATKSDFEATMAIHPTSAEELVTL